ncbi:bifunctional diguanylate cyclase/phosphodiesterase [Mangrovicoccus sp. HB161399]|uniref:putative bifunctional diguanylate cyclase/phosphodiesterase n=1 Tax=Mangrovicoccus sp. HB161399 TaxID=2720392 RepID=UPI0015565050|nr:EAL domain-containing protein [Mangrovicoccus sp. HB161399]
MTLRRILALSFLLACGLPLLVFWLWPHSTALEAELERARERHLVLAQAAAETLSVYQENVTATFAAIVSSIDRGADLSFAGDLLESQAFSHFCVIDAETGQLLRGFSPAGVKLPDRVPPELLDELKRRIAEGTPPLSEVWIGAGGDPQFLLAQALGDRIVFASVNGSFLKRIADKIVFGQGGHMAIIDAAGRIIAHPNPAWVREARDLGRVESIRQLLDARTPGIRVFFSPALNENVVAGVASVGGSGWHVLVPQPVSEVHATIVAGRKSAILVFSSGLALSALVAIAAAAFISRPLNEVAAAAEKMAAGEEGIAVGEMSRFAPSELRALGVSFNRMARRIERTLERVTSLARQDPLTGLLNKRSFEEAARRWLDTAGQGGELSLLLFDLDNLKTINDVYGHAAGDSAIEAVARGLQAAFPPPCLVSRAGGDEFQVLGPREEHFALRRKLAPLVSGLPVEIGPDVAGVLKVACSIGVAHSGPGPAAALEQLVNRADEAMYLAKERASGLQVYQSAMHGRTQRRLGLSALLKRDVEEAKVGAVFQPVFCARTGAPVGFETLARWQDSGFVAVPPQEFLGLARDASLLNELDCCIRRQACALARALRDQGSPVQVSVNVTAPALARADFLDRFRADLDQAGLGPRDIAVEVTETIFHDRHGLAVDTLSRLAGTGIAIHLDDFGKGFSAHGLLPLCKFEGIKIDLRFAGDPLADPKAATIVGSLARLGADLGLAVTMEGIETERERQFALGLGAQRLQGFLHARPMGHAAALDLLRDPKLSEAASM